MSISETQTDDFSHVSVINARLTWLRRINSLTSVIFGTSDMTFEIMIFGAPTLEISGVLNDVSNLKPN